MEPSSILMEVHMIKSMTGYGRAQRSADDCDITVEIRSVNHRYFDCTVRIPRIYVSMEEPIKARVQNSILRGKVDVFVTIEHNEGATIDIQFNSKVAEAYVNALGKMREMFSLDDKVELMSLARFPEVFTVNQKETDENALLQAVLQALGEALEGHDAMRLREGDNLRTDILSRVKAIEEAVGAVETRSAAVVPEYREKLLTRMKEVLADTAIDESRILTEAALYADRIAVDEETVRIRSHMEQLCSMLKKGGAIGRKLDFLIQEFNREANTIGSKANDIEIARKVVEIKAEIEKIREQVQNIE
jgi:uncharacterized protein (TIGR00255 family)